MPQFYYKNAQTSDYKMKTLKNNDYEMKTLKNNDYEMQSSVGQVKSYSELSCNMILSSQNQSKTEKFKERLEKFKDITTLSEAKELLNKIMPVTKERTKFNVGDAKCIIINKENLLKISYISPNEFINYSFI